METKQQIDHLIELAIVQRAELKRLVEQLPALRSYLLEQINATIEDMEPQLRGDLIDFCDEKTSRKIEEIHAFFNGAKSEFKTKSDEFFVALEKGAQARFEQLQREKQIALDFAEDARRNLAVAAEQEAAKIPAQVSQLVEKELARFPRAGEIDQLRKEFAEPRGLNPRGKWKSTETYQKLDLVAFNGDSYISNVNDNREKPSRTSVSWTLSAARGQGVGGGGISSLNDLVGPPTSDLDVVGAEGSNYVRKTLTAGTNVTLTETPTSITISADDATSQILTATVTNAESVAITRGQVVYAYAATGNRVSVKLAYNTSDATSAKTFGVVSDDSIAAGGVGTVTCIGVVDKLNLGTYAEGDTVYLSATPGAFTSTKPYAPNHLVYVGIVERANNGNGQLYVKIQNGYELDEIHDVQITAPVLSGSTLLYDATNSLWKNARLTGTANQVKITNADNSVTLGLESQIAISGQSLTGSSATSLLDLSTTWNTTGNPTALKLNVTNTASGSSSLLADLQLSGSSIFKVDKSGIVTINSASQPQLYFGIGGTRKGYIFTDGTNFQFGSDVGNMKFTPSNTEAMNASTTRVSIPLSTASTSTSTGALVVSGGVGVAGALYTGDNIVVANNKNILFNNGSGGTTQLATCDSNGDIRIGQSGKPPQFSWGLYVGSGGATTIGLQGSELYFDGGNGGFYLYANGRLQFKFRNTGASYSAWGTTGIHIYHNGPTVTDSSTLASGTAASAVFHSWAQPTLAATNASVTTTDAATLYVAGGPLAGTNQTLTNSWGLWNAGKTRLDGLTKITDTTAATSTTSGSFQTLGGAGIAGAVYAGADSYFNGVRVGLGAGAVVSNTVVGTGALNANTTGDSNVALGYEALKNNTTGVVNVAIGRGALNTNTTGSSNTAVGRGAGATTTGSNNVFLGYLAGYRATGSQEFYLDNQERANNAAEKTSSLMYGTFNGTVANQTLTINAATTVSNTTDSTSTSTGSLVVSGGLGVAKNLYVGGGTIQLTGAVNTSSYLKVRGHYEGYLNLESSGSGSTKFWQIYCGGGGAWGLGSFGIQDGTYILIQAEPGTSGPQFRQQFDAAGNCKFNASLKSTSPTGGIGYATGAGGAVTQATDRTTGVTINKVTGAITLVSAAGTTSWQSFTVTNSAVAATDVVKVVQKSGTDLYQIFVTNVAAGSFQITYATTGGTTTEQPVFNFAVIKGVAA